MKKKIIISIVSVILLIAYSNQAVYAVDANNWVSAAFSAAGSFLSESSVEDKLGIVSPVMKFATNLIQGANRVLLFLLAGVSMVALSVVGIRYIIEGTSPQRKGDAKKSLHTVFMGMFIGFGAYAIWRVAMAIVVLVIAAFSTK